MQFQVVLKYREKRNGPTENSFGLVTSCQHILVDSTHNFIGIVNLQREVYGSEALFDLCLGHGA